MQTKDSDFKALIMVVDDNVEFLGAIELTLEMAGYKVWRALNGQHALGELQAAFLGHSRDYPEIKRLPDLIISDIMMPVMDGYAFYKQVQNNPYLNHLPFIFLTAKLSNDDIRRGKELGVDDYLAKGADPDDILASVRGRLKRIHSRATTSVIPINSNTAPVVEVKDTHKDDNLGEGPSVMMIIGIGLALLATFFWLVATFIMSSADYY